MKFFLISCDVRDDELRQFCDVTDEIEVILIGNWKRKFSRIAEARQIRISVIVDTNLPETPEVISKRLSHEFLFPTHLG